MSVCTALLPSQPICFRFVQSKSRKERSCLYCSSVVRPVDHVDPRRICHHHYQQFREVGGLRKTIFMIQRKLAIPTNECKLKGSFDSSCAGQATRVRSGVGGGATNLEKWSRWPISLVASSLLSYVSQTVLCPLRTPGSLCATGFQIETSLLRASARMPSSTPLDRAMQSKVLLHFALSGTDLN